MATPAWVFHRMFWGYCYTAGIPMDKVDFKYIWKTLQVGDRKGRIQRRAFQNDDGKTEIYYTGLSCYGDSPLFSFWLENL